MGWIFECSPRSKTNFIEDLTRETEKAICLAKSTKGNHLWTVWEEKDNKNRHIVLFLLSSNKKCWGYKDISESAGPCYYDCPKKFLKLVPIPDSPYAQEWRDKVLSTKSTK